MPDLQRAKKLSRALFHRGREWRTRLGEIGTQIAILTLIVRRYALFRMAAGARLRGPARVSVNSGKCLLVISYYAAPYKSLYGTQRLNKFIKYLTKFGWRIVLITTSPAVGNDLDQPEEPLPQAVTVIRLPQYQSYSLPSGTLVPDHFIGWIRPALEAAREAAATQRPSALFATVPPYSNAVVAALLAMETGIPLVTDFRDPWTRIDTGWVVPNKFLRWLSGLMERLVLKVSAGVVMADEGQYAGDFFVECRAAEGKVSSILNGYDEDDFSAEATGAASSDNGKFVVSYAGVFYDGTTFMNVRRAFEQWHAKFPAELENVEFHYAGASSTLFDKYAFRPAYLRDHGYVSHHDAIAIRAHSNVQMFSQPSRFKPHVISGKIYEMMRIPIPIIAITNPSGTVARFVTQTGTGLVVDNRDPNAAAQALRDAYLAWKSGRSIVTRNDNAVAAFSREAQAKQLADVMERIIRGDAICGTDAVPKRL